MSDPPDSPNRSFLDDLRRRHVVRVLAVYAAVAFVVIQVAALTFEPLHLPPWTMTFVVVVAILGFPIAAVLTWALETTPEGVRPAADASPAGGRRLAGFLAVVALLTVAAGVGAWVWLGDDRATATGEEEAALDEPPSSEHSIAVLPLDDLSADPEDAYLAGALTEEITSALSQVPGLKVVSRTSAEKAAGTGASTPEIGVTLGVEYVLEGSVRRAGDEVAVVVQLIDAATDEHLWTERYERSMEDVLGLQVEIARRIADELRSSFTEREIDRIRAGSTDDPVAYDLYLRSREYTGGPPTREEAEARIGLLERAVERDPGFADAWALLGFRYRMYALHRGPEWADSSRVAMERAVERAEHPALKAMYRGYGAYLTGENVEESVAAIRRALEENPGDPLLTSTMADLEWLHGDLASAVRWTLRARELDPMNAFHWSQLGWIYRDLALDERAEDSLLRALELDRGDWNAWQGLTYLRQEQGRHDEALALQDSFPSSGEDPRLGLAFARLWAGEVEGSRAVFEQVFEERPWEDVFWFAPELAHLRRATEGPGGIDSLIDRAERTTRALPRRDIHRAYLLTQLAGARGDGGLAAERLREYAGLGGRNARRVRLDPVMATVRSDPEFQAALAELEELAARARRQVERVLREEDAR